MKNININQLSKKLDYKMIGLLNIIEKKSILLELQLSQPIKIHNILHLNLFWKTFTDPLIDQIKKSIPLIIIDNEKKWEVKYIFNTKSHWGKIQY